MSNAKKTIEIPSHWAGIVFLILLFGLPWVADSLRKDGARELRDCALHGALRENLTNNPELVLGNCLRGLGE